MSEKLSHVYQTAADDPLVPSAPVKTMFGGVCDMTIGRWVKAGVLPKPLYIRGRKYWRLSELLAAREAAAQPKLEVAA